MPTNITVPAGRVSKVFLDLEGILSQHWELSEDSYIAVCNTKSLDHQSYNYCACSVLQKLHYYFCPLQYVFTVVTTIAYSPRKSGQVTGGYGPENRNFVWTGDATNAISHESKSVEQLQLEYSLEPGPIQGRGPGRDCMRMHQNSQKTWDKKQWRIQETGKGCSKLSSTKRKEFFFFCLFSCVILNSTNVQM